MNNLISKDINDIQLSIAEHKLLCKISKNSIIRKSSAQELCAKYKQSSALLNLLLYDLVDENRKTGEIQIVTRGKKWLEFYNRNLFEKSLPIVISILSLIVSVISLIMSLLI